MPDHEGERLPRESDRGLVDYVWRNSKAWFYQGETGEDRKARLAAMKEQERKGESPTLRTAHQREVLQLEELTSGDRHRVVKGGPEVALTASKSNSFDPCGTYGGPMIGEPSSISLCHESAWRSGRSTTERLRGSLRTPRLLGSAASSSLRRVTPRSRNPVRSANSGDQSKEMVQDVYRGLVDKTKLALETKPDEGHSHWCHCAGGEN